MKKQKELDTLPNDLDSFVYEMEDHPKLLANRIRTPDGTILHSKHRHDYVTHKDKNGETYSTDGGIDYAHRSAGHNQDYEEMDVYSDAPHQEIRAAFHWGTRGKDGKSPLEWKPIETLSTQHIEAIIETQHHIPKHIRKVFEDELKYRETLDEGARAWYNENPDRG